MNYHLRKLIPVKEEKDSYFFPGIFQSWPYLVIERDGRKERLREREKGERGRERQREWDREKEGRREREGRRQKERARWRGREKISREPSQGSSSRCLIISSSTQNEWVSSSRWCLFIWTKATLSNFTTSRKAVGCWIILGTTALFQRTGMRFFGS